MKEHILIIEDDEAILRILRRGLSFESISGGYSTRWAGRFAQSKGITPGFDHFRLDASRYGWSWKYVAV